MHLHILGVCGTFMGGIAALARAAGHRVTGSDSHVYPPMSTQLEALGIEIMEGFEPAHLEPAPDIVVVGNVVSRGNAAMEYVLNAGLPYVSGPQWLAEHVLGDRHVMAVAGTHGKTSTSGMLAWILEATGRSPGFLIGGVPGNFDSSARLGDSEWFVVEADEYDTAFFDKRSKFVHYRPRTLILNNLEFDHADIFDDLAAIQRQFHHLIRTIPGKGCIISNAVDPQLEAVLEMGCWSRVARFAPPGTHVQADWQVVLKERDGTAFTVKGPDGQTGEVRWGLLGHHNVANAVAAVVAAAQAGIDVAEACTALERFVNAKRRMQLRGEVNGIRVYDDFAHHPTAIATTIRGLRDAVGEKTRILAVLEPRSNTMRMGVHQDTLAASLQQADRVWLYQPDGIEWDMRPVVQSLGERASLAADIGALVAEIVSVADSGDQVLIMSNGAFGGIHDRLLTQLSNR